MHRRLAIAAVLCCWAVSWGAWTGDISFTTTESTSVHWVAVPKQDSMAADYRNIRFCDSSGNNLPYWIDSSNVDTAWCHVGFSSFADSGTVFRCVFGESGQRNESHIVQAYRHSGYVADDFSRDRASLLTSQKHYTVSDSAGKYESWPKVAKDSNGRQYVVYRTCNCDEHAFDSSGYLVLRHSDDDGKTWSSEITVSDVADWDDRGPGIECYTYDETEYVGVTYHIHAPGEIENSRKMFRRADVATLTWDDPVSMFPDTARFGQGRPIVDSRGYLQIPCYRFIGPNIYRSWVAESQDGGSTWTWYDAPDTNIFFSEWAIVETKDADGNYTGGRWGIFRKDVSPLVHHYAYSLDHGQTWSRLFSAQDKIFPATSVPVDLRRMSDGNIYAITSTATGTGIIYRSADECSTWTELVNYKAAGGGSTYGSMTETSGGYGMIAWADNEHSPAETSSVFVNYYDFRGGGPTFYSSSVAPYPSFSGDTMSRVDFASNRYIFTNDDFNGSDSPGVIIEFRMRQIDLQHVGTAPEPNGLIADIANMGKNSVFIRSYTGTDFLRAISGNDNWYVSAGTGHVDVWTDWRISWRPDTVQWFVNDTLYGTKLPSDLNGIPDTTSRFYIYEKTNDALRDYSIDHITIRPYTATDPVATIGTTTERMWVYNDQTDNWYRCDIRGSEVWAPPARRKNQTPRPVLLPIYALPNDSCGLFKGDSIVGASWTAYHFSGGDTTDVEFPTCNDSLDQYGTSGLWLLTMPTSAFATDHDTLEFQLDAGTYTDTTNLIRIPLE